MKTFHCDRCGQQVFYENVQCENCGGMLGYQPAQRVISTFESNGDGLWRSLDPDDAGRLYRQCRNYFEQNVCNWMIPAESHDDLCPSCRLTQVLPDLSVPENHLYWSRLENAKRRLLYSLWQLGLQPTPGMDDPEAGLSFRFLADQPESKVLTGHADGVITINVAEADDAARERMREEMQEPYRTLLGHFRHESGHYYFDRLIAADPSRLHGFRCLFGDESVDYGEALQRHYRQGPQPAWDVRYVSPYAASHPWEDWAETWAHYLHMFDTLDTAFACGVKLAPRKPDEPSLDLQAHPLEASAWKELSASWFALTYMLNSLNRSMGASDAYPFALSPIVQDKLRFVHEVVRDHAHRSAALSGSGVGP